MHQTAGRDFEWDAAKARANLRKHGIDFADVAPVFEDEHAITIRDELSAVDEQRFLTVGRDARGRVVVVAYTWRGSTIRIVSARKATPRERRQYVEKEP
jgi:uncharacterized DUF497 family protein